MKRYNQLFRMSLILAVFLLLILGVFLKPHLPYLGGGMFLILVIVVFYSGRKQRIRYWFQGYKNYLAKFNGDEKKAIANLLEEFRSSKYGNDLDVAEYFTIEALIEEIILREYKFNQYLMSNGVDNYRKLLSKLRKEIEIVKREILN